MTDGERRRRSENLERTVVALRDAREVHDMLAIVARGMAHDFRRPCVAYELRGRAFAPVPATSEAAAERGPRAFVDLDLDALRVRGVVRYLDEDLVGVASDGQLRAILALENGRAELADDDLRHLRIYGGHASLAITNALAFEQLRRYAAEGAALVGAAQTILGATELGPLAATLCSLVNRLVVVSWTAVYVRSGGGFARIGFAANAPGSHAPARLPADEGEMDAALRAVHEGAFVASRLASRSGPEGEAAGLLVTAARQTFHRADLRLIDALLSLAALALRNVDLYEQTVRDARELTESNAFKDDLMAMVAHDFRGPLTVISGYSELLLESGEVETRRTAQTIFDQTHRLAKLSEDALALAATQSTGFSLQRAPADLAAFVYDTVAPLDLGGRVALDAPPEPVMVTFDRGRLRHVIENVVGNALKYSTDLVSVTVAATAESARIDVSDLGIGIPATDADRIFTRFGRGSNARSRGFSGSGVGLYIAKKIVEVHGGTLSVRSMEGSGSTFSIELPRGAPGAELPRAPNGF